MLELRWSGMGLVHASTIFHLLALYCPTARVISHNSGPCLCGLYFFYLQTLSSMPTYYDICWFSLVKRTVGDMLSAYWNIQINCPGTILDVFLLTTATLLWLQALEQWNGQVESPPDCSVIVMPQTFQSLSVTEKQTVKETDTNLLPFKVVIKFTLLN